MIQILTARADHNTGTVAKNSVTGRALSDTPEGGGIKCTIPIEGVNLQSINSKKHIQPSLRLTAPNHPFELIDTQPDPFFVLFCVPHDCFYGAVLNTEATTTNPTQIFISVDLPTSQKFNEKLHYTQVWKSNILYFHHI